MKEYEGICYSDNFKICYGPDSLYGETGIIRSYEFHPETTEIYMKNWVKVVPGIGWPTLVQRALAIPMSYVYIAGEVPNQLVV